MTPEEIRKQMMGSTGLEETEAGILFQKADTFYKNEDYNKAFVLAEQAAQQGHMGASCLLGVCYAKGKGTVANHPLAKSLWEKAADSGLVEGKAWLAVAFIYEEFGPANYAKALSLLNEAIAAGYEKSFGYLGMLYMDGCGVDKDIHKALSLFEQGIAKDDPDARANMAKCYRAGLGVERSLDKALELARAAKATALIAEIEAEIAPESSPKNRKEDVPSRESAARESFKRYYSNQAKVAVVLAVIFGPFGLLYISWKRAAAMLLVFIASIALLPSNNAITILLWSGAPLASIVILGLGNRQPPPPA